MLPVAVGLRATMMLLAQRDIVPPSVVKKAIFRCRNKLDCSLGGTRMTLPNEPDRHSDYDPRHLALYGVAVVVLLVFAWSLVH